MDFGEVLTKAWKIVWKFKVLWVFGILSSCGQGGGGGGNSSARFSGGHEGNVPPQFQEFFNGVQIMFDKIQGWQIAIVIFGLFMIFLILSIILFALNSIGRIGLIQGTVKADTGAETLTFIELFNGSKPFFWRILGINLLAGWAMFFLTLLIVMPFVGLTFLTFGIGLFCLLPLLCILVPSIWLASVVLEQANIAIIVENLSMLEGLKRGWQVFKENIGNMIVMALLLGIGGGIIGFILALPLILALAPIMLGFMASSIGNDPGWAGGGLGLAILCILAYLPVLILLNGILQAYIKSAWTLTYLRLTSHEGILASDEEIPIESLPVDDF